MCSDTSSSQGLISHREIGVWHVSILFPFLCFLKENILPLTQCSPNETFAEGKQMLTRLLNLKEEAKELWADKQELPQETTGSPIHPLHGVYRPRHVCLLQFYSQTPTYNPSPFFRGQTLLVGWHEIWEKESLKTSFLGSVTAFPQGLIWRYWPSGSPSVWQVRGLESKTRYIGGEVLTRKVAFRHLLPHFSNSVYSFWQGCYVLTS